MCAKSNENKGASDIETPEIGWRSVPTLPNFDQLVAGQKHCQDAELAKSVYMEMVKCAPRK